MTAASPEGTCPLARRVVILLLVLAVVTSTHANKKHRSHRIQQQLQQIYGYGSSSFWPSWSDVGRLSDVVQWKVITFDFEGNENKKQEYQNSGRYDPVNILLIDAEKIGSNIYATTPPFKSGTPASFSIVATAQTLDPPLRPFPSWEAHATTQDALINCSTQMVSVFRFTRVPSDANTLYLIDSGLTDIASTFQKLCAPKIVTLDIASGTILDATVIDKDYCNSLYISIQVEETRDGRRVAYSADVTGFALAVTDLTTGETRRVTSEYYYPTPGMGVTTIAGVRSYLMDGLFALGCADGDFYSWAFASNTLNKVSTSVLRNATDDEILDLTVQTLVPGQRSGPAGPLALDAAGRRMFFGIAEQTALYCWDTRRPYQQSRFRLLAHDAERLQFFSSVKLQQDTNDLFVVTDRFNKFGQNIVDQQSVNYRLMSMNIGNINC